MSTIAIRPSADCDLAAVTDLYAHYVRASLATFELDPPGQDEMARRRQVLLNQGLPWLVAERDGEVVGYAYAGPYRTRPAYAWTLEDSIYVRHDSVGLGVGRALLLDLIGRCATLGYRQMVAIIGDSANAGSIALHAACGFRPAGVFSSVGWKFGRWVDSVMMQRPLGTGDGQPAPPLPAPPA